MADYTIPNIFGNYKHPIDGSLYTNQYFMEISGFCFHFSISAIEAVIIARTRLKLTEQDALLVAPSMQDVGEYKRVLLQCQRGTARHTAERR